jgi:hypothetical protein
MADNNNSSSRRSSNNKALPPCLFADLATFLLLYFFSVVVFLWLFLLEDHFKNFKECFPLNQLVLDRVYCISLDKKIDQRQCCGFSHVRPG